MRYDLATQKCSVPPVAISIQVTWENVREMASKNPEHSFDFLTCYLATPGMSGKRSVRWEGVSYFAGYTSQHGVELWKSDAGAAEAELVADLLPGTASSSPSELVVYRDRLYFTAEHGTYGREMWVSDGTAAGTACLQDAAPGRNGSNPSQLTLLGNTLLLTMKRPTILDGASYLAYVDSKGTLLSIAQQEAYGVVWPSNPREITVAGGFAYFAGTGFGSGTELWRTSGQPNTAQLVRNILEDTGYDSCKELWRHQERNQESTDKAQ
jgi:ELWxxDGT repeat protein